MTLNQIKLGPRLALAFSVILVLVVGICAVAWSKMGGIQSNLARMTESEHMAQQAATWQGLTALNVNRTLAIAKSGGHEDVKAHFSPMMKATSAQISELQKSLETSGTEPDQQAMFADIAAKRKVYISTRDQIFQLLDIEDPGAKEALESRLMPMADTYLQAINAFRDHERARALAVADQVNADVSTAQWTTATMGAICLVVGMAFSWVVTLSVTRPLRHVVSVTRAIAGGDLTRSSRVEGNDEVAEVLGCLQDMRQSLSNIVGEVRESTDSIRVASTEVAAGSLDLSSRTEQTASSLQQTASSMEQISTTVEHSTESANNAQRMAQDAATAATKGGVVVSQVVATMGEINERSRKIGDIISVIDGIAFQTNILALNAAVEAARAGEQGRGFAVVASEVRSLAQRSAQAAKEIKVLITASAESVEQGTRLVEAAGLSMTDIVSSVQHVSQIVGEITEAAREQSAGIGLVNGAVNQLDQMTQQNAALVEQSAAAAESLKDQSVRLAEVISVFKLTGDHA